MFTIFLSLKLFLPRLPQPFSIFLRTDNAASLHACLTFKAKSPLLTHLTAEFLLELLCHGWTPPTGEHIAGVLNDTADALSRGEVPPHLAQVKRIPAFIRHVSIFRAWPYAAASS